MDWLYPSAVWVMRSEKIINISAVFFRHLVVRRFLQVSYL